ncbi:MAG TPA: hypothetical protein DCE55_18485 [Planctomycetaceae bacterium]|nr:hypothetical protein [Planctomycetaceae bacterium]|tara:strand:+ start:237 stop:1259 length:1023 start_codon:yes stop_codon:yes gene_type:complete
MRYDALKHCQLAALLSGLLLSGATATADESASEKLLAECQGTWIRTNTNNGTKNRVVKVIEGNKETVSYFRNGMLTRAHQVEIEVSATEHFNLFTFKNGVVIAGPDKGDKFAGPHYYAFKIEDNTWYEVMQLLKGGKGRPNVTQYQRMTVEEADQQAAESDQKADQSAYTQSGPDVQLIKNTVHSFAKGDIDGWLANFADDARYSHNKWGNQQAKPIAELADVHRELHTQIDGEVKVLNEIYEVVTVKGGGKHGHAWLHLEQNFKTGEIVHVAVFVAFGINKQGKLGYEWAIYDTSGLPDQAPYKPASGEGSDRDNGSSDDGGRLARLLRRVRERLLGSR